MIISDDYRGILKSEFNKRAKSISHKRYTLGAFAKELNILQTALSDILNYKKGMSEKTARKVSHQLGFKEDKAELFCQLVLAVLFIIWHGGGTPLCSCEYYRLS